MSQIKKSFVAFTFFLALFVCVSTTGYAQGNTKDVNVANTPSVRDADNPARQPVQAAKNCSADNVIGCQANIYTVHRASASLSSMPRWKRTLTPARWHRWKCKPLRAENW